MKSNLIRFIVGVLPTIIAIFLVQLSISYIERQNNLNLDSLSQVRIFEFLFYGYGIFSTMIVGYLLRNNK